MTTPDALEATLGQRPVPGEPRPFTFPAVERSRLSGGFPSTPCTFQGARSSRRA